MENVLSLESSLDFGNGLALSYHLTKMALAKPMNLLQATYFIYIDKNDFMNVV